MDESKERVVIDFSRCDVGKIENPEVVLSTAISHALSKEPFSLQLDNLHVLRRSACRAEGNDGCMVDLNFGGYYGGPECTERIIALAKELTFAQKFDQILLEALPKPSQEVRVIARMLDNIRRTGRSLQEEPPV